MEIVWFSLVGIVLYLGTEKILQMIEQRRGEHLKNRNVLFFLIIMPLTLITFTIIQNVLTQ